VSTIGFDTGGEIQPYLQRPNGSRVDGHDDLLLETATVRVVDDGTMAAALMPLQVGNKWVYGAAFEGSQVQDTGYVYERTFEILGTAVIDGSRYYHLQIDSEEPTYLQTREKGLFAGDYDVHRDGEYWNDDFFFRYPVTPGTSYTYKTIDGTREVTFVVSSAAISVPAGTFDCLVYEIDESDELEQDVSTWSFAPGIGLIQSINLSGEGGYYLLERFDLLSYSIGGRRTS
jgi:hypothetical protein